MIGNQSIKAEFIYIASCQKFYFDSIETQPTFIGIQNEKNYFASNHFVPVHK